MKFHDLLFEYIYRNSGISKEKIFETERDVIGELDKRRKEFETTPENSDRMFKFYFKWEKHPAVMLGLLLVYTIIQHLERYRFNDMPDDDDDDD